MKNLTFFEKAYITVGFLIAGTVILAFAGYILSPLIEGILKVLSEGFEAIVIIAIVIVISLFLKKE